MKHRAEKEHRAQSEERSTEHRAQSTAREFTLSTKWFISSSPVDNTTQKHK